MLAVYKVVIQGYVVGDFPPKARMADWPLDVLMEEMRDHYEIAATVLETVTVADLMKDQNK